MMQTAEHWLRFNSTICWRFDFPVNRTVFLKVQMSPLSVGMAHIFRDQTEEVSLSENDAVIETLSPDTADHPLHIRILPRGFGRGDDLFDAHILYSCLESTTVDTIPITK